ncbi:hypothetical protein AAG747_25255 [Rapidithrix thailandica]|uniref:Cytochrome c domain-containing protein n=1 Tax=Rapidithrix thailandica TaxID=413964 RepID=A0AAW9SDZ5_9BACT
MVKRHYHDGKIILKETYRHDSLIEEVNFLKPLKNYTDSLFIGKNMNDEYCSNCHSFYEKMVSKPFIDLINKKDWGVRFSDYHNQINKKQLPVLTKEEIGLIRFFIDESLASGDD